MFKLNMIMIFKDYHVFVIVCDEDGKSSSVYDLDSELSWPCPFDEYFLKTFPKVLADTFVLREREREGRITLCCLVVSRFRVVEGSLYLQEFASDRSHMLKDNQWLSPPPAYEPIQNRKGIHV